MLDRLLSKLPGTQEGDAAIFPFQKRQEYLQYVAATMSKKPSPTNFVRTHSNPVVQRCVHILETQRFKYDLGSKALDVGIGLIGVGLEVAIVSEAVDMRFRVGMAIDYIHWLGRLLRSDIAGQRYGSAEIVLPVWTEELTFVVEQVSRARKVLGDELGNPVLRLLADPLIIDKFKIALGRATFEANVPLGAKPPERDAQ
jgi:hypothetical protein